MQVIMIHMRGVRREEAHQATRQEDGASPCNPPLLSSRSPMGGLTKHKPTLVKMTWYLIQWDAGVFLQVQRSAIRQSREARYHGPAGKQEQCWRVFERVESVSSLCPFIHVYIADTFDLLGTRLKLMWTLYERVSRRLGRQQLKLNLRPNDV